MLTQTITTQVFNHSLGGAMLSDPKPFCCHMTAVDDDIHPGVNVTRVNPAARRNHVTDQPANQKSRGSIETNEREGRRQSVFSLSNQSRRVSGYSLEGAVGDTCDSARGRRKSVVQEVTSKSTIHIKLTSFFQPWKRHIKFSPN